MTPEEKTRILDQIESLRAMVESVTACEDSASESDKNAQDETDDVSPFPFER